MTPPTTATPTRRRLILFLVIAAVSGALIALQARINGQLAAEVGDGYVPAFISFSSGMLIVAIAIAASRRGRRGLALLPAAIRRRELPWWFLCGGLAGGLFVLSQSLTVALIGIALFTVALVAGQTIVGLLIDAHGIGTVAPKRVTVQRIVGTVVVLVAVIISVGPQINGNAPVWALVAPFIAGLISGWQQAVNGQVRTAAGSPLAATFVNFVGGTLLLAAVVGIHVALTALPTVYPTNPLLYLGGLIGVVFITGFALVIPVIGVLLQSLAAVCGQLLMSIVLDLVLPTDAAGLPLATLLGTALTFVGIALASGLRPTLRR